jgi:hypothetical protein
MSGDGRQTWDREKFHLFPFSVIRPLSSILRRPT